MDICGKDVMWIPEGDCGCEGGRVRSVNGQTGDVLLTAEDVGAIPAADDINSDWDENDSTKLSYILNRPFYAEQDGETYTQTIPVVRTYEKVTVTGGGTINLTENQVYTVEFDGVEYSVTCLKFASGANNGKLYLGNPAYSDPTFMDSPEPFLLIRYSGTNKYLYAPTNGDHTIAVKDNGTVLFSTTYTVKNNCLTTDTDNCADYSGTLRSGYYHTILTLNGDVLYDRTTDVTVDDYTESYEYPYFNAVVIDNRTMDHIVFSLTISDDPTDNTVPSLKIYRDDLLPGNVAFEFTPYNVEMIPEHFYERIGAFGDGEFAEVHNDIGDNIASGASAFAEGSNTTASGDYSHAEGARTIASGSNAHAEGNNTLASGYCSHAEGQQSQATGIYSHAEGSATRATGQYAHTEGQSTKAAGNYSHAEGSSSEASGQAAHAEGLYTRASSQNQHVQGKFNVEDTENTYAHIVGNGTSTSARSNAHTLDWSGNAWFAGDVIAAGGDITLGNTTLSEAQLQQLLQLLT